MKWTQEKVNVTRLFSFLPVSLGSALLSVILHPSTSMQRRSPLFRFILTVVLAHLQIYFSVWDVCFQPLTHARQKPPNREGGGEEGNILRTSSQDGRCVERGGVRFACVCHVRPSMFACV